jgi:pimeloyl-ACP methyl ester carboxylesterase
MSNLPIKLYMIPGSGTDWRMYIPQLDAFPDMLIPDWLPPLQLKESLESYCKRLAKTIDTSTPFVLGGVSLGGIIAQEMALSLKPEALILIATCSTSKALPLSRRLAGKLTRALPDTIIKLLFNTLSTIVLASHSRRKEAYAAMLKEISPPLVRWQSGAATKWKLKEKLTTPIFQIHGDKDPIIPLKNISAQYIVRNGGHLINATHENQVNAFISESLAKIAESEPDKTFASMIRR